MRDLEKLRLAGQIMMNESGQGVLECIGKMRYYNKHYLSEGTVHIPKHVKKYRLGLHGPGEKINIKIVDNK